MTEDSGRGVSRASHEALRRGIEEFAPMLSRDLDVWRATAKEMGEDLTTVMLAVGMGYIAAMRSQLHEFAVSHNEWTTYFGEWVAMNRELSARQANLLDRAESAMGEEDEEWKQE